MYLTGCNYQLKYYILSQLVGNNIQYIISIRFYDVLNVTNSYIS